MGVSLAMCLTAQSTRDGRSGPEAALRVTCSYEIHSGCSLRVACSGVMRSLWLQPRLVPVDLNNQAPLKSLALCAHKH